MYLFSIIQELYEVSNIDNCVIDFMDLVRMRIAG